MSANTRQTLADAAERTRLLMRTMRNFRRVPHLRRGGTRLRRAERGSLASARYGAEWLQAGAAPTVVGPRVAVAVSELSTGHRDVTETDPMVEGLFG